MATLLDINSNSSDSEDDCDYVPPEGEISEESEEDRYSSDDNENVKKAPKRKRGKSKGSESNEVNEKPSEKTEVSAEAEKQKADELWKSFLSDVGTLNPKRSNSLSSELTHGSNLQSCDGASTSQSKAESSFSESINKPDNTSESSTVSRKKETITEQYEFAGETVTVTREVDLKAAELKKENEVSTDSTDVSATATTSTEVEGDKPAPVTIKRKGGLNSVIGTILGKKQKMTTLQKSLHDWNTFKKDEGIEGDLEKYNKGKGGYLERQAFLLRSDHRRFELEKSVRLSKIRK